MKWLPDLVANPPIFRLTLEEARKTLLRYRSLVRNNLLDGLRDKRRFAVDAPWPEARAPQAEVSTKDMTAIVIPRRYLALMCDEGLLEKAGYGRYKAKVARRAG